MRERVFERILDSLKFVPDQYKTEKMCERAVEGKGWILHCS